MQHKKITIVVRGKTEAAIEAAQNEAIHRLQQGNVSGVDSTDDGGFYFDTTNEVPRGEQAR